MPLQPSELDILIFSLRMFLLVYILGIGVATVFTLFNWNLLRSMAEAEDIVLSILLWPYFFIESLFK